ncbi:hypothetical protein PRZ48_003239 [Zasmidium cellare]|uniref:Cytochrome b-c1 complex subunit 10 n=1 Tax=Zasmidium cellare TaxID=395010 RepID=A0ABR0EUH4_ZASCE|nr:hypothetical protein PRZ48_003239 [Zasmidium cellare]
MLPTLVRRSARPTSITRDFVSGQHPWRQPTSYETFRSKYGPQYKIPFNVYGVDAKRLIRYGGLAGAFGAAAGIFAIFFFDGVPRVQKDILQKVPIIGNFFVHEIPPEDNPF